jgi:lysozyme
MEYSKKGLYLTESFEGCKMTAYQDPVGVWTVGYGHIRGVQAGLVCTQAQAGQWLRTDIAIAEHFVNTHVHITLTQGEFDALVDFAFNLGIGAENGSTLLALVNQGKFAEAALQFPRWDKAGGHESAGLLRRRLAEQALFNQAE